MTATAGSGRVTLSIEGPVARVLFDRPAARNAMTFAMYAELLEACDAIDAAPGLRAAAFRGAGDAFVAGTDISEFTVFAGREDGIAYERRVEAVIGRLERLTIPTLAIIDGPAMGGGLVLAAACDLRLVTTRARLGVPIAQTLGNCLSAANIARLVQVFGRGRVRAMLLAAETLDGPEARAAGFALDCVAPEELEARVESTLSRLATAAPLTIAATRELLRRLEQDEAVDDDDVVGRVYASADFREGVAAFLAKRKAAWKGA
jgi:enoyl-CoA hydratase